MTEPSRDDLKPGITPGADLPVALDDRPLLSETPRSWIAVSLTWAAILAGTIALFKYAIDVLLVILVLACVAFVLQLLIRWLAKTELLTPAWAIIILLIIATLGWMGWPVVSSISPLDAVEKSLHFERILPRQAVRFLERAEQHGWAQRVLTPRDASEGGDPAQGGDAGVSIVLTSSQRIARAGQPVTLSAALRFSVPPASGIPKTVEFLDGSTSLGWVTFQVSGDSAVASITTAALAVGPHTITARYARALLFGSVTSPPVTVTVTP